MCASPPTCAVNLRFWPLMRVLDCFMLEGARAVHRMGMVVLSSWYKSVSYQPKVRCTSPGVGIWCVVQA